MWMMSCSASTDRGNELKVPSSFKDLKLRPLFTYCPPKNTVVSPITSVTSYSAKSIQDNNKSCNHILNVTEQNYQRKDLNIARGALLPLHSTRWSPTPEQLMALQELYRRGTRTPTAQQIQEITAKLRRFGKIEGKNVFYWFQNHKARDKKKQRLKMESQYRLKTERRQFDYSKSLETKASVVSSGPRATGLQVEQTKRDPLSNYSRISEESVNSMPRVTIAETERGGTNKLVAFEGGEEEKEKDSSTQPIKPMEIMSYTFPSYNYDLKRTRRPTVISLTFDEKLLMEKAHDYNSSSVSLMPNNRASFTSFGNSGISRESCSSTTAATTTLELFPLQSDNLKGAKINDQIASGTSRDSDFKQDLSLSFSL